MTRPTRSTPGSLTVPPLCNGDRLTAQEFERRYTAMPGVQKAQLIEGIVYMPSPVSALHSEPHGNLICLLGHYRKRTPGVRMFVDGTVRLDSDNNVQPDVTLMLPGKSSEARLNEKHYIIGSPELVCEVSVSSASIDMNEKLNAYRRNGIREYLAWRVEDEALDLFKLRDGRYEATAVEEGLLRSEVFPGLWVDIEATLADDLDKAYAAVDAGCATDEHAAFVKRLAE